MKNKEMIGGILAIIGVVLSSMGVVNLSDTLPKHEQKTYKKRSVKRPLKILYHHTATEGQNLTQIARGHLRRGFPEIGYHFAIDRQACVYQLNDINEISWHDSGNNTGTIGIVFIGNYEKHPLPDKMLHAAKRLQDSLSTYLNITGVGYHGQTSPTLCPGKYAIKKLKTLLR